MMSNKIRTFLDAGVLIAAVRGASPDSIRALTVLADARREFVTSDFLELELLPKPVYFQRQSEAVFLRSYFAASVQRIIADDKLVAAALNEACVCGMAAVDALHVVAAHAAHADELITTEKATKPIYRTQQLKVTQL